MYKTDKEQITRYDLVVTFYIDGCAFFMPRAHNIGKNAEVEFGAFSFITSPLMKCSKSYFMSLHEYMDLTRA